jgi:LynF/TruF/PatF family peptide O-prenyltransferase
MLTKPSQIDYNLSCLTNHQKAFNIDECFLIKEFKKLVQNSENSTVECSCKIEDNNLYSTRFNLWFFGDDLVKKNEAIQAVTNFINKVEKRLKINFNYSLFNQFYDNSFDLNLTKKIITGIDLRQKINDSRLKIWFIINNYPEKLEQALLLQGDNTEVRQLIFHNELLVGFDFFFDGRTKIKLYPDINKEEFQDIQIQKKLKEVLSDVAINLMSLCFWTHISFTSDNAEIILHYHPLNPQKFIKKFVYNQIVDNINNFYQHQNILRQVISVKESELIDNSINSLNLYYGFS